jgi:DNA polymerase-3 subunit gamma/tau
MLLKGINEVRDSAQPLAAAEMVLVRIAYAADLPTPDEVIRSLGDAAPTAAARPPVNGGATGPAAAGESYAPRYDAPRGAPRGSAAAAPRPAADPAMAPAVPTLTLGSFEDVIALAAEKRDLALKAALERDVRLVRCEDGKLELALEASAPKALINDLSRKLALWTGKRWMVAVSAEPGLATVKVQNDTREAERKQGVRANPLVQSVLTRFPGAEIVGVTIRDGEPGSGGDHPDDDAGEREAD